MTTDALPTTTARPLARHSGAPPLFAPRDREDDAPRLLPDDDDVPRQTLDVLGQARDALILLIGGVFQAAGAIVTALLRLVESVAGRDVAEAVDDRVADAIGPFVPPLPASALGRETGPGVDRGPAQDSDTSRPSEDQALHDGVRDVLLAHAGTEAEREAVSPAFVEMVTTGVRFVLSVERQFPGALDALRDLDASTPEPVDVAESPVTLDASPAEPAVAY